MKDVDGERLYSAKDIGHVLQHVLGLDTKDILDALQSTREYHDMLRKRAKQVEPCWDCKTLLPHLESVITPMRRIPEYPIRRCDA